MMQRFPAFGYVLCAALASCATPKPNADSSAALTTDTLKAAPVAMQAPDTTKAMSATTGATTKAKTTAKRRSSKTSSKTTAKQNADTHLGRDSVIKFDPRDPRRQLPTIPPKKPPQER